MARATTSSTKKERLSAEVSAAVGAGRVVSMATVDFNDPNRPKTCLEVDFPILPVNQVAAIEGNAGKPIYQMSKWWARRRSSVFRSMLLAAGMRAPDDPTSAAKAVWDVYYANHQEKGAFSHLKVADIFMGGGTTLVEGSRLGMQLWGTDLNPVAWLVVKNELARVDAEEVQTLLDAIESDVKPQVIPFYATDCPRGHKGTWTRCADGHVMEPDFRPLTLKPEERKSFRYAGPETIYVFWAKHGPCQVTGCGHRTPIMSSPVVAIKTLTIRAVLDYECSACKSVFDVEEDAARMAPGVPLVVAATEKPYAVIDGKLGVTCPHCGFRENVKIEKEKKKVDLTLLIHPEWLAGSPQAGPGGVAYGGSATDSTGATAAWNCARAERLRLVEVRGALPAEVTCPETHVTFRTDRGTVPRRSTFTCQAPTCGREQDVLESVKASGKTGPVAAYVVQGFCPECHREGRPYGGRFFAPVADAAPINAAIHEWEKRKEDDLSGWWPRGDVPYGFMTGIANGDIRKGHGFTHWWTLFNPRQLLGHAQLLKAIASVGDDGFSWTSREYVLGAFQQYLRNQSMLSFWHLTFDKLAPGLSNANFHPKSTTVEVGVFPPMGYGPWSSTIQPLFASQEWRAQPWELVSAQSVEDLIDDPLPGKSIKIPCNDKPLGPTTIECGSASELTSIHDSTFDLVVTDPPFGGLLHYSELSNFFYVWLHLVLKDRYPTIFGRPDKVPDALEVVANRARNPEDADAFYQRLLAECWREANRILKPGGILAFTFHHSEDEPWIAVLESLFDAGFYLEATYPIRSDETKGEGEFGSKKIEYDIIHVCRKRIEEPTPVSWGRMRREVLQDVRRLKSLLEHHAKDGLPAADLQVIKRGKALEYYSRHYGKVYVDENREVTVRDALLGINQLLDEESGQSVEPPPIIAEPLTRQLLRIFENGPEVPRDQMQKYLRGTGIAPSELEERGWCEEDKKVFRLVSPLAIARSWQGKLRKHMKADYDQAMFLIGASVDGSGINVRETLRNDNFQPHPALGALLDWHARRGHTTDTRSAAARATAILRSWQEENREKAKQLDLFFGDAA